MASDKLGFMRRYQTDRPFKEAVENFMREAVFVFLGIDPDRIAQSWNGEKITLTPLDLMAEKLGLIKPEDGSEVADELEATREDLENVLARLAAAEKKLETVDAGGPAEPAKNPVADLDAKGAKEKISEAEDPQFLMDVFTTDSRVGIAMEAARALFDLRSEAQE